MPWHTGGGQRLGAQVFAGEHVVVAGWGMTGRSAADVLTEMGARVTVLNSHEIDSTLEAIIDADPQTLAEKSAGVAGELLIVSPGWPPHHPVLASWRGPIWSDIELAWHIGDPATRWIVLTGTNGKTTTIGMVGAILEAAGRNHRVVGNVGVPIVRTVWDTRGELLDNLAVELSSFQLHHVHSVSPVSSAVLNLADDHIDWHGSFEEYAAAKARIYERTRVACVYNREAPATRTMVEQADVIEGARAVGFTLGAPAVSEVGVVEGTLVDRAFIPDRRTHGRAFANSASLAHLEGPGGLPPHMVANALAAAALTLADSVTHEQVHRGLSDFRPDDHRMQQLGDIDGVHFINDSKATNAHAAQASLAGLDDGRVVWILGGLAKGAQFDDLVAAVAEKIRAAVIIGVDHEPFSSAISRHAPHVHAEVIDPGHDEIMRVAVETAASLATPGDTVLLAPAGASMDQFQNYEARGDAFIDAVARFRAERS